MRLRKIKGSTIPDPPNSLRQNQKVGERRYRENRKQREVKICKKL